jgi:hypothetical protein
LLTLRTVETPIRDRAETETRRRLSEGPRRDEAGSLQPCGDVFQAESDVVVATRPCLRHAAVTTPALWLTTWLATPMRIP